MDKEMNRELPGPMPEAQARPAAPAGPAPAANQMTGPAEAGPPAGPGDRKQGRSRLRSIQKRIDELTRARHQAQRERDYWREVAHEVMAAFEDSQGLTPSAMPDPEKYATEPEYYDALDDWTEADGVISPQEQALLAAYQQAQEQQAMAVLAELEKGRAKYPDFDAVVMNPDLPITEAMLGALEGSDKAVDVAYQLGKNPEAAKQLAMLPPLVAAKELGKIEARLEGSAPGEAEARRLTRAPEPIRPVGNAEIVNKNPERMSNEEYRRWREKRDAKKP